MVKAAAFQQALHNNPGLQQAVLKKPCPSN